MQITIKMARNIMGLKQNELRKLLGTTQSTLSKVECGIFPGDVFFENFDRLFKSYVSNEIENLQSRIDELKNIELIKGRIDLEKCAKNTEQANQPDSEQ